MRSLRINQQPVFYKLYEGEEDVVDQYGNPTGSYVPKYGPLKSVMLCVSPNKGSSEVEQFGSLEDYDRTMTTSDTTCDIDEDAVLWIDGADTDGPWNAIVKQVAPWKNSIQYAIAMVSVSIAQKQMEEMEDARKTREAVANAENNAET